MADEGAPQYWGGPPIINPADSPEQRMALAMAHMQSTMPSEARATKVSPISAWLRKLLPSGTIAATNMFGNVSYDPSNLPLEQPAVDDVLAHELTHVKQRNRGPLQHLLDALMSRGTNYSDRPNEQEAFETQRRRANMRHDIPLAPER